MPAVSIRHKPVKLVPFWLNNIEDFQNKEHPEYFPESVEYDDYWEEQLEYCIHGKWGDDSKVKEDKKVGGWRWMPGNLYFYINLTKIKKTDLQKREYYDHPDLRDIEWLIFYGLATCDGFSGFEDDKKFTSNRIVKRVREQMAEKGVTEIREIPWDDLDLSGMDEILFNEHKEHLYKPDGTLKEYIEAREYLYQTFSKPMGKPLYHNEYKGLILLSSRGVGKSYSVSNGLVEYGFTFNGARSVDDYLEKKTTAEIVVGSADSSKSAELLNKFTTSYDLLRKEFGAFYSSGIEEPGPFYHPYEGSLKETGNTATNAISEKSGKGTIGPGSQIHHVAFNKNNQAGVGYRARYIILEEAGLLENFVDVHRENKASFGRDIKTGYPVYIGTGGNMEKIQGIKDAYRNPKNYDCLGYKDHFSGSKKEVGLFIPSYYRKGVYKDAQGNTDYKKAYRDDLRERDQIKDGPDASKNYDGHITSYPFIPDEMFLESGENIFDTRRAQGRIMQLEDGLWNEKAVVGRLDYVNSDNTQVKFTPDSEGRMRPIIRWGDEDDMRDKSGAPIIYEQPIAPLPEPNFKRPMYMVFYDPRRNDGEGSSLASVIVFKFWQLDNLKKIQYNIVAEWIGRHEMMYEDHEIAFKFAHYYNAKILPEVNINHVVTYGHKENKFHMFQPRPGLAIDASIKQKKKYEVGVYVARGMKSDMITYANEYLNTEIDRDERFDGEDFVETKIKSIDQMYSLRMLDEIIAFRPDSGNYDHISSLALLGLQLVQMDKEPASDKDKEERQREEEELKSMVTKQYFNEDNPAFIY